ncbi:MAG: hypothetical protein QHH19_00490 [Candidatus Thermoplasmatota archaeon]|jgi:hypothetical protein|nr:hypothetical protein [Candidatus Thermoplasmatota archaeon]
MKELNVSNKEAVMGLPIYLIVAIIVASAITAVLSISIYNVYVDSQFHKTQQEVNKIVYEAENMFEYADEGTMITIKCEFPSYMKFVVFGGLPKNKTNEINDLTLDENTSNNYFFVMNNGEISVSHSTARFSGKNTNQVAVFYPGIYDLKLELVKEVDGKTYVKIYK